MAEKRNWTRSKRKLSDGPTTGGRALLLAEQNRIWRAGLRRILRDDTVERYERSLRRGEWF